ncbi:hypothetical protein KEU06_20020 [Pseudaminobacter sp. 19-2017]|uniref:Uncharacterized protein n=1 Tax=Pseudaminobacter soli (ex Zhang et al. 2022) TaxID=2831468 RepID=A0A942E4B0_9HYPH|nr:hypothetical protein [Pseudaminobacter soli]MBS3650903.1 hypothetical protein [Pseudaminobacter soli]
MTGVPGIASWFDPTPAGFADDFSPEVPSEARRGGVGVARAFLTPEP